MDIKQTRDEVTRMIRAGHTNKEIAEACGVNFHAINDMRYKIAGEQPTVEEVFELLSREERVSDGYK